MMRHTVGESDNDSRNSCHHIRLGSLAFMFSLPYRVVLYNELVCASSWIILACARMRTRRPITLRVGPNDKPTSLRKAAATIFLCNAPSGPTKPNPKLEMRMKGSDQLTTSARDEYPSVIPASS